MKLTWSEFFNICKFIKSHQEDWFVDTDNNSLKHNKFLIKIKFSPNFFYSEVKFEYSGKSTLSTMSVNTTFIQNLIFRNFYRKFKKQEKLNQEEQEKSKLHLTLKNMEKHYAENK